MKLSDQFKAECEGARQRVAKDCGVPFVVTVEAMGFRIVPKWMVPQFERVLAKLEEKVGPS